MPGPPDSASGAAGLAAAIREAALLEGDFLLRSGTRSAYYLDKYRFATRPDLLRTLGIAIAAAVAEHEPDAVRLAAPELGAVPLAAAASLESELPFVIVRGAVKKHGTGNRIEGVFEPGERVCLIEDIVTAGGAALEAVEVLREAGLVVSTVVCVVDRDEGGADALARAAVRLRPLLHASEVRSDSATPHG
jgi:orotate phosphoribosyltransferase